MRKIYLLVQNDIRTGPFSLRELLQQSLHAESLIWIIGESEDWLSPLEIPALHNYFIKNEAGELLLHPDALTDRQVTDRVENAESTTVITSTNFIDSGLLESFKANNADKAEPKPAKNTARLTADESTATAEITEDGTYGLGKNKWPVLATITLLVLLIVWSIVFNKNDRTNTPVAYTNVSTKEMTLPVSNTIPATRTDADNEIENSESYILPIIVPSVKVSATPIGSTGSTSDFLDSVNRVLDSQDLLMAAVDEVYKKSFSKRTNKPIKPRASSLTHIAKSKAVQRSLSNSATPVNQQVDLQSRFIRNGNKRNLSGVEVMVKNNSKAILKTVSVDVFYYKNGERLIDKETVYFSNLYPRQSLTMSIAGNQKATSARMQLGAITLAERP